MVIGGGGWSRYGSHPKYLFLVNSALSSLSPPLSISVSFFRVSDISYKVTLPTTIVADHPSTQIRWGGGGWVYSAFFCCCTKLSILVALIYSALVLN